MPSKNTSVISARVKDETAIKLGEIAENKGITIAKLIDEMVEDYEEKEDNKKGVTPDGYAVCRGLYESRVDKELNRLSERGYPDSVRRSVEEQVVENIRNLPKYNAKRMKCDDWGC